MTEIDYAARVAKGVALLDQTVPGWVDKIDLETLDVQDGYRCVTAQLSGQRSGGASWEDGMRALDLLDSDDAEGRSYSGHGFNALPLDPSGVYYTLNALWKGVIAERRAAADTDTPEGTS